MDKLVLFIFLFYRIAVSWLSHSVSVWSLSQHVCRFSARNGTSITITSLHTAKSSVKRTIFFAHEIVKCMGKNLDIANFRWSIFCQYLWLSLYRGSTVWRLRNACGHVGILLWVKLSVNLLTVITLVMGRKDYCSSLLFNVPATHIAKNPRVQNCQARLVCRTPLSNTIRPHNTYLNSNEWMNEWTKSEWRVVD